MKKRSINKFMALVLGMSLTVTALAGCGQKKSSDSSQTASTQSGASESAVSEDSEEENAIKWSGTITVAPYMLGPIENDEITPLLEEKLLEYGYDVTLENVYIEDSQYKEILNLKLASGEAPDIFYCHGSVDILQQYLDQGLIATWDEEFFREHAPNVAAFIDAGEPDGANADVADVFWAMARFGGEEMCVLPTYAVSTGSPINVVYNKQWLDNLNAEVPETLDEFVELMYRFTNEDPDGNGKDDTYGFSTTMLNVIFGAYGSFPGFLYMDYGHWYDVDGKLVAADVMDGNEEALKLLKQLYADGVIDPEFLTGENTGGYWALSHSFINGQIGVHNSAGFDKYLPAMYDKEGNQISADGVSLAELKAVQGEDAEVVVGPWPEGPNGDRGGFLRLGITVQGGTMYNATLNDDPEKLAAIFAIRDIFNTDDELAMLANFGIEGKHYYYTEDGYFATNSEIVPDNAAKNAVGIMAMRSLCGSGHPENYTSMTAADNTPAKEYLREQKAQYEGLADTVGYTSEVWGVLPSATDYSGELQTYRDETWLNMIQGKIELDWDAYVEEWYNRGGQILTEEANEWYEQNK